jgi:hypothetical protein
MDMSCFWFEYSCLKNPLHYRQHLSFTGSFRMLRAHETGGFHGNQQSAIVRTRVILITD